MFALFVRRDGLVVEEEYRKAQISDTISAQRGAAKVRLSLDDVESLVITGKRIDNKLELILHRKNRNKIKLALLLDGIDKDDMLLWQKPYGWEGISILPIRKISVMRGKVTETKHEAEELIKPEPKVAPTKVKKPKSQAADDPNGESRTATQVPFNEIVYQAQKRLNDLAYDPGPIDGIWGSQTKAAIKKYQSDHGLSETGELDSKTKMKLGLVEISRGSAPCKIPDGVQVVHFSDGAEYKGQFKNCRPLSCHGEYKYKGKTFRGWFESDGVNSVTLKTGGKTITIKLESQTN